MLGQPNTAIHGERYPFGLQQRAHGPGWPEGVFTGQRARAVHHPVRRYVVLAVQGSERIPYLPGMPWGAEGEGDRAIGGHLAGRDGAYQGIYLLVEPLGDAYLRMPYHVYSALPRHSLSTSRSARRSGLYYHRSHSVNTF